MRYRLERARDLLLSTDRSVREIAALTGFQDPLYLSPAIPSTARNVPDRVPSVGRPRDAAPGAVSAAQNSSMSP